jgi:hydroxymethylpyrimidine pyrophosphatase-like HAD family hydrolase
MAKTVGTDQTVLPYAVAGVTNLLCGADELTARLRVTLADEQWLNAYLLAAGLGQLVEDRLHPDPLLMNRVAKYLHGQPSRPAHLAATACGAVGAALRIWPHPAHRRLALARHALAKLTGQLAAEVMAPHPAGGLTSDPALLDAIEAALPALTGEVQRIPACFHSFDQYPDDVRWLVRAFRQRYPQRDAPLCVVGVRTSGCYLAPLHAAELAATGDSRAGVLTYRPGRPFLGWERSALRAVAQAGGLVLVVDDPPGTGTSLAATARAVSAAGVPDSAIIFLIPLFGTCDDLPQTLRGWPTVVQPWAEWSVHARLTARRVAGALGALLCPGTEVAEVQPLALPQRTQDRGHARAQFAVRLLDRQSGESVHRHIVVEGAGLGYFGTQGYTVASALPQHVPHVYGFADGLLYRDWLPPGPDLSAGEALADTVAGYVTARREALPAPSAAVDRLGGRDPAWEVAGMLLSGQFGPLALPARPLLLEPLMRRLLRHDHPTVLDGNTDLRHWLADPVAGGGLRKVDFYQRAFGHLDLACYDPVCDLAGAAADPPSPDFEAQLREAYHRGGGQQVDGERWLLYRLAKLWRLGYVGDLDDDRVGQRSAAAVHDYLAGLYLRDLPAATGELCAIDLDGVLECGQLGYPATSATGALALRALVAHGYRPVLVTGRSVADVRDRCAAFGLAGGVAEYGCAVFHDEEAIDLRPPRVRALLDRIRDELARCPGVRVDPRHAYAVRAAVGHGPVPQELLARIPALANPEVRVIHGQGQTDITVTSIDKGSGLRALAGLLGQPGCALAVGDSQPDLPLLACAPLARAPRNARLGAAGGGIKRTGRAYQAGLAQACAELLGHRPGRCPVCRPPAFGPRTRAVLAILDLRANGLASIPAGTVTLSRLLISRRLG